MSAEDVLSEGEALLFEPCAGEPLRKRAFASWAMQHGATMIRMARENAHLRVRIAELEAGRAADMQAYERADDRISEMAMLLVEARRWATRVEPSHELASYVRRIGVALRESSPERNPDPRVP